MFTGGFHLSEKHFEEPMKFKPERFINSEGEFVPSDLIGFFGIGKRRCPGETLARAEVNYNGIFQNKN